MELPTYYAYNGIPTPTPTGDPTPCVAVNGKIGQMRDAGKSSNQANESIVWRAQANGPLLVRIRFDVTGKPAPEFNQSFWDQGWKPSFVARVPDSEWARLGDWVAAGWSVQTSPGVDPEWLEKVTSSGPANTFPCPYVGLDYNTQTVSIHSFVLDLTNSKCRAWIVDAAHALRIRLGQDGIGVDGWEVALKSKFWRNPQSNRSTPTNPGNGGTITDTPFGVDEFEAGYQQTLRDLHEGGFKMLVSDHTRPGDTPGDWLDADVVKDLLGNWKTAPTS